MVRFRLYRDEAGYCLNDLCSVQNPLRIDYLDQGFLRRLSGAGKKNELIARAVKSSAGLRVLDCTGGFGKDAMILAQLGCVVTLLERSTVMSVLLSEALHQARGHDTAQGAASRICLLNRDAVEFLASEKLDFDVIYLDPMFPPKRGAAAVNGDMQQLQRFLLEQDQADAYKTAESEAMTLLTLGLGSGVKRVVLKRPTVKTESILPPTHVFQNKNSRYETYVC